MHISDQTLNHLVEHGYAVVPGFLSSDEISAARQNMLRYVPTPQELAGTPERYPWIFEEGERLQTEFPFAGNALNHISTHPDLIDFVERALGTQKVMLTQSAIWAKYAGAGDFDQALHLDYEGNTLVVPRDDGDYRQINMILYYTDVTADLGPTCVVPTENTSNIPLWPTHRPKSANAALYKHEKKIIAKAGTLFLFGMRTWHRASDITAEFGVRLSHHMIWRSSTHPFQGFHLWSHLGEKPDLKRFTEFCTPRQREVLGFPPPGDPYWTKETLKAVAMRYPRMDMKPYKATRSKLD